MMNVLCLITTPLPHLTTYTAYDPAGRTVGTWGATYPVAYEYDNVGHMIAMYTYRGTNAIASYSDIVALKSEMDRTQWLYDQATGLLTNKLYADGKGSSYSYTDLGQLATRKWARLTSTGQQLLTQYKYDNFGSLTNTAYSDGTPSIAFTFNALGQMKSITDASGTRSIDYATDGQLVAENLAFGTSLFTVHEKYDSLGRNQGYALSNDVAQITGTMQTFDQYGRLNQVAVDGIPNAFTYGYLDGTHLQKTLAMPNGVTRTFGYEANRDLLTMIVHSNATERLVQRDFTFDGFGRLIDRTLVRASGSSSSAPDAFGYNLRSELTNAVIGANAFAYDFDPIGNRKEATEFGTNTAYITSALNQYTSISNSVSSVPLCEMNPEFDADGNQTLLKTTTGIWHVTYNAENRPILFSNETTVVEMAYDYMGRRFEYKETVSGTLTRHERYLYRGYLQLAALDMLNSTSVKRTIAWDASEPVATRPLALQIGTAVYYYSFDQVKNVTELFDSTGAIAATYDYSPFGQVTSFQIAQSGNNALTQFSNPLTFSSEIHDSTLGLQYYNYRHLNTLDGRWVNRDPIGERGGKNVYGLVRNLPIFRNDRIGLADVSLDEKGARGTADCGVVIYLTHAIRRNWDNIDVKGSKGCRRAAIVSCFNKTYYDENADNENLIKIPVSEDEVGIGKDGDSEKMNGGKGPGINNFYAYMTEVFMAAKNAAEGLCPDDRYLNDKKGDKCCKEYREKASGSYPDDHWLHYDSKSKRDNTNFSCCHCKKITLKFVVPFDGDRVTYKNVRSGGWMKKFGEWTVLGTSRVYDCKEKSWDKPANGGGLW